MENNPLSSFLQCRSKLRRSKWGSWHDGTGPHGWHLQTLSKITSAEKKDFHKKNVIVSFGWDRPPSVSSGFRSVWCWNTGALSQRQGQAANGKFNEVKCAESVFFLGISTDVSKDLGSPEMALWKVEALHSYSQSSFKDAHFSLDEGSCDDSWWQVAGLWLCVFLALAQIPSDQLKVDWGWSLSTLPSENSEFTFYPGSRVFWSCPITPWSPIVMKLWLFETSKCLVLIKWRLAWTRHSETVNPLCQSCSEALEWQVAYVSSSLALSIQHLLTMKL